MEYIDNVTIGNTRAKAKPVSKTKQQALPCFASVEDMVKETRPCEPVHCLYPDALKENAALFLTHFPGTSFYAVKVNPDPFVLRQLHAAGIRHFDVASRSEARLIHSMFDDAHMAFMHPVKSREAIREAYFDYGIRDFSVDTFEELHKILEETRAATDLGIHVRLHMPKGSALLDISSTKFGASAESAISLLRDAEKAAHRVGVCFHVGSQTMDPDSFVAAIKGAGEMLEFFDAIRQAVAELDLPPTCQIWGEPGRALVANAGTVVVRVELRKGNALYINDGTFGSLFDAGLLNWRYPVKLIRPTPKISSDLTEFLFYGPTCTCEDIMKGPFLLPNDVCEGDWIAISQMGAYGASMQTSFNGFSSNQRVEIKPPVAMKKTSARKAGGSDKGIKRSTLFTA